MRAWSIAGGSGVAVLGTFLPWLRSGAVDRSSYEIFDLVDRAMAEHTPEPADDWARLERVDLETRDQVARWMS